MDNNYIMSIRKKYIKAPVRDLVLEFPYNTGDSVSGEVYTNYSGTIYSQTSDGGVISGLTIKKNSVIQSFPFKIDVGDLLEINFDYTSDEGTIFLNGISSKKYYLLDKFKNATVGYSLRKLRNGYTGSAIRVIRDSDNAFLDVGFVNDELDVSSLMSFIGGDTAFVHTWYFQGLSGEGIDAVQAVKANMPRIVHNGVIETLNGKPTLNFMANQYFDLGYDSRYDTYSSPGTYGYVVASLTVIKLVNGIFGRSMRAAHPGRVSLTSENSEIVSLRGAYGGGVRLPAPPINTQNIMYQLIKGNTSTVGVNATTNTISPSSNTNVGVRYFIGAYANSSGTAPYPGFYLDGKMQELVQFYNDKSAVQLDIRDEINNYYGTY